MAQHSDSAVAGNDIEDNLPPADEVEYRLRRRPMQMAAKRAVDLIASATLLVLLAPLFALTALAIKLDSPGPVLFSQPRWGWKERRFRFYKFRSMVVDAPRLAQAVAADGTLNKQTRDPRVTRVGRILRRTSIDELPQLWNVMVGDMSLVGPRPLVLPMLEPFPRLRAIRCAVRPGLTGLWQVNARAENTHVASMARWDLEYLGRVGLVADAAILARTIGVVLSGRGAV